MTDLQLFLGKNLTCFITSVGPFNIKSLYWPYTLFMSCSQIAVCSDSDGFRVPSVHHYTPKKHALPANNLLIGLEANTYSMCVERQCRGDRLGPTANNRKYLYTNSVYVRAHVQKTGRLCNFFCFTRCFCSFTVYLWFGFGKLLDNLAGFIWKCHILLYIWKKLSF